MTSFVLSLLLPLILHAPPDLAPAGTFPPSLILTDPAAATAPTRGLRFAVVGDTGEPGPIVEHWHKTLAAEPKDAVLVPGDLVYEQAPPCPTGTPDAAAIAVYDERVGHAVGGLGAPTYLVIGNHDVAWVKGEAPRERCLIGYAELRKANGLIFPTPVYAVDFGLAVMIVLNTNHLDEPQAVFAKNIIAGMKPGQRLIVTGHHVMRTYGDKDSENKVRPWLEAHGLQPGLWINGHAHVLQMGVYGGIPSVTSGTGASPRDRATCPPSCGEGQLYGSSTPGYAMVSIDPKDHRFAVAFKDADGKVLYTWNEPEAKR